MTNICCFLQINKDSLNTFKCSDMILNYEGNEVNTGMIATEITYIGEWDFTQYRRNAPFLMKI